MGAPTFAWVCRQSVRDQKGSFLPTWFDKLETVGKTEPVSLEWCDHQRVPVCGAALILKQLVPGKETWDASTGKKPVPASQTSVYHLEPTDSQDAGVLGPRRLGSCGSRFATRAIESSVSKRSQQKSIVGWLGCRHRPQQGPGIQETGLWRLESQVPLLLREV